MNTRFNTRHIFRVAARGRLPTADSVLRPPERTDFKNSGDSRIQDNFPPELMNRERRGGQAPRDSSDNGRGWPGLNRRRAFHTIGPALARQVAGRLVTC